MDTYNFHRWHWTDGIKVHMIIEIDAEKFDIDKSIKFCGNQVSKMISEIGAIDSKYRFNSEEARWNKCGEDNRSEKAYKYSGSDGILIHMIVGIDPKKLDADKSIELCGYQLTRTVCEFAIVKDNEYRIK